MESKLFGGMRHEHICARRLDISHTEGKAGDGEESDGEESYGEESAASRVRRAGVSEQ